MIPLVDHPETHTEAGLRRCPAECTSFYGKGRQCPNPIKRGFTICGGHLAMETRLAAKQPVRRRPA